jgi:hypothetical protein
MAWKLSASGRAMGQRRRNLQGVRPYRASFNPYERGSMKIFHKIVKVVPTLSRWLAAAFVVMFGYGIITDKVDKYVIAGWFGLLLLLTSQWHTVKKDEA